MARLQILQLPAGAGDDRPPFVLVVDQTVPQRVALGVDAPFRDYWQDIADRIGARAVIVTPEAVEIPSNEPLPLPLLSMQGDSQTAELIAAHEQIRQALCDAFLLSLDSTWVQIVETARQRQREVADLYRKFDARADLVAVDPKVVSLARKALGVDLTVACPSDVEGALFTACRELEKSGAAREHLTEERAEARRWARHGYEIGQRHCGWSDHGVAPGWLTEGWPYSFDFCEHLKQAAELDEAVTRVRAVSAEPKAMNAGQERPDVWVHGYGIGVRAAKAALNPRNEPTVKP